MTITLPENYDLPRGHKIEDVLRLHPIEESHLVLCVKQCGQLLVLGPYGYSCSFPSDCMWNSSNRSIDLRPKQQMLIKTAVDTHSLTITFKQSTTTSKQRSTK